MINKNKDENGNAESGKFSAFIIHPSSLILQKLLSLASTNSISLPILFNLHHHIARPQAYRRKVLGVVSGRIDKNLRRARRPFLFFLRQRRVQKNASEAAHDLDV